MTSSPTTTTMTTPSPSTVPKASLTPTNTAFVVLSISLIVIFIIVIIMLTFHRRQVAPSTDRSEADLEMQPPAAAPQPQGDGRFRFGQFLQPPVAPERASPRKLTKPLRDRYGFIDQVVTGDAQGRVSRQQDRVTGDPQVRDFAKSRGSDSMDLGVRRPQEDDMEIRPVRV